MRDGQCISHMASDFEMEEMICDPSGFTCNSCVWTYVIPVSGSLKVRPDKDSGVMYESCSIAQGSSGSSSVTY